MKNWHYPLLSIFAGIFLMAVIYMVSSPPRGASVTLLPPPTPAPVIIHLSGAVNQPGVYSLPRDSRIADAVESAGGLRADANADAVNLAAPLKDGQKIVIPTVADPVSSTAPIDPPSERESAASGGPTVNLNTASSDELQTLPGIGSTRAAEIIAYRQEHGDFQSIDEIQEVPGIGAGIFDQIRQWITTE